MRATTSAQSTNSPGASFTYFVLGAAPGRQPQDLLRDYLSMDWVHGTPTATATVYDGRAITAADLSLYGVPEAPPLLTLLSRPGSAPVRYRVNEPARVYLAFRPAGGGRRAV